MKKKRRKSLDDLIGVYTIEEEMTGIITTYYRLFPISLSYSRSDIKFYYEFAINFLGIELSLTFGGW